MFCTNTKFYNFELWKRERVKLQNEIIIYNTDDGKADVKLYSKDGVIWMNQQQMALLFYTSKQNISLHIVNILQDKELDEKSVVKDYTLEFMVN